MATRSVSEIARDGSTQAQPVEKAPVSSRRAAGQDPTKRDQILNGAEAIFCRAGFDRASMNDITREAGVSKSTIYVYFSNKDELFSALLKRQQDRVFEDIVSWLQEPGSVREMLTRYGLYLATLLNSDIVIRVQRMVIGVAERKPHLARQIYRDGRQRSVAALREYIENKVDEGILQIDDSELAAAQFLELCLTGTFRARLLADMEHEPSQEEIRFFVDGAVDMFLKCYGKQNEA